jgi:hypothetical protein
VNISVDKAVNLQGLSVWCGVSSRGVVGPLFLEGTVTGQLYGDDMQHQPDGAPPPYHVMSGPIFTTLPDQ